ncbi:MAG TPA: nidogen-like domain-containing protein, partial [Bacteroidia bacterium]|nr:nidogen-like domain-containing protein [Bacteroidia bacterium]
MKSRITILVISFVVFTLISIKPKAQTTTCDCWKQRDNTFTEYPFNHDISGPVPTSPYYRNDDAYGTNILTLPFSFCFYGNQVNQIYINNNGFVTWGPGANALNTSSSSYEPQTLPLPVVQLISPFWSDEDTRNVSGPVSNGLVFYKVTPTYIIIQWDTVSYYGTYTSSQDNSFQLIISNGTDPIIPNGNNIEFCYQQMQWAVGNAQAGNSGFDSQLNPAEVGINEGNGVGNIQYGLFNTPTSNYAGPYPPASSYDGVYWLDNREFIMNGCTGNAPPFEMSGSTQCDTLKICEGDTVKTSYDFYSVLTGSTVATVLGSAPSGVSIIYNNASGPSDSVVVQIIGNSTNTGVHTIVLYSFDNLSPADTLFTYIVVDISPSPPVTISAVKDTICLGNSSVLTAGGGVSYSWSTGGTTSSITVTPTVTTTYSVAISTNSCTKDTTVTVVVEPPVTLIVNPLNSGICAGDSLSLKVTGATSYSWAPATGLNCSTCSSVNASPSVTTVYTITGTSNGCSTTITDSVKVNPLPIVSIAA